MESEISIARRAFSILRADLESESQIKQYARSVLERVFNNNSEARVPQREPTGELAPKSNTANVELGAESYNH